MEQVPKFHFLNLKAKKWTLTGFAALYETTNTITQKQNYEKDLLAKKKQKKGLLHIILACFIFQVPGHSLFSSGLYP